MFFWDKDEQKMTEILINVLAIRNRIGEKGEQIVNDSLQEALTILVEKDALKRECQIARLEGQITAIVEYVAKIARIVDELILININIEERMGKLAKSVKPRTKKRKPKV